MSESWRDWARRVWKMPPIPPDDPSDLTSEEWAVITIGDIDRCPVVPWDPLYREWTRKNNERLKAIAQARLRS